MNRSTLVSVAAVLSTLNETPGGSAPESILYVGLGMDAFLWTCVAATLTRHGLATIDGSHRVEITDAGRELARKIDNAVGVKS